MKKHFLSKIVSIILVTLLIISQSMLNVSAADNSQPQTRGAAVSILSGATLTSNNNNPENVADEYNFTLEISGSVLAEIGMNDKKTAVFAVPEELLGQVTPKSNITVTVSLLPFTLNDIGAIATLLAAVGKAVDAIIAVSKVVFPPVDLSSVRAAYDTMVNTVIDSYTTEIAATVSTDGRMIYANFDGDLNTYIVKSLKESLTTFSDSLSVVPGSVPFQNSLTTLRLANSKLQAGITLANVGMSLNADFLKTTTASLDVEVVNPTTPSSIFKGDIISNSSIDVSFFDGLGGSTAILFSGPWDSYIVPTPTINPVTTDSTAVTGNVTVTGAPTRTTFEVTVAIGNGTPQTVDFDPNGNFTLPITGSLVVGETVTVVLTATNDAETKTATETVDITAGSGDSWDSYIVPTPTINPVTTDSTAVTGNVTVTGAPTRTTFEVTVAIGNGTPQTVDFDPNGNFTLPITGSLVVGETVTVVLTATNDAETKTATETVDITAGSGDSWDSYIVPTPTINPVTTDSTAVTGNVTVTGAPTRTTFEVTVAIGNGTPQTVDFDPNGNFTLPITGSLVVGETVTVVLTATNDAETKTATETVDITAGSGDSWDSYIVPTPTINPVTTDSTAVTGNVTVTGAPTRTTFEVTVAIGNGTPQTVDFDPNGNFTLPITGSLVVGETVTVVLTATNDAETKTATETVDITAGSGDSWDSYIVPTPTINPVTTDSTAVTGNVTVTGAPTRTTFEVTVAIGNGTPQTVDFDPNGNFTLPITGSLVVGETVTVVLTATNDAETKTATETVDITAGSGDSWDSYIVPTPTINPVTTDSTAVTGNVTVTGAPTRTTFEVTVAIGNGTPQTVDFDPNGNFTLPITGSLVVGETVTVVLTATNDAETKTATETVDITAGSGDSWDSYIVPTPTINPVTTDSTAVTGNVTVTGAPTRTTFEVTVAIGNGTPQTVDFDPNGNFTLPITGSLVVGETVTVVLTATNDAETKTATETVDITAGSGDSWDSYIVPTPTINPVTTDSTAVTGNVTVTGAPTRTTFEVTVAIGNGTPQTVDFDPNGNFTLPITGSLVVGETVTVVLTATNDAETKTATETVDITAGSGDSWDSYIVPTPTINPVTTDSTAVTGNVTVTGAPTRTTFEVTVAIGNGTPQTVDFDPNGNFTLPITGSLVVGETVTVVLTATNDAETKTATETVDITAGSGDSWDSYIVPTPTINPVTTDSTAVTGNVTVTGAPTRTTFEVTVAIGNGTPQTVDFDPNGNFTLPITGSLVVGETVTVVLTATNDAETKTATETVDITAGSGDSWDSYIVPTPTINPVTTDSTAVTGNVTVTGAPTRTTFEVTVAIGNGTPQTVDFDPNGNFTLPITGSLVVGETVTVVLTATNDAETKTATETVDITAGSGDSWDSYIVPTPTINPVTTDSTAVTGNVTVTGAPTRTTFEVTVAIGNGTPQTVDFDPNGNFTLPITGSLVVGETVTVVLTATNDAETKTATETVDITAGSGDSWDSYIVPSPTIAPVNTKSTQVSGNISLAGAPAGTTFAAKITIGSNPTQIAPVDSSGNFTNPITEAISTGNVLTVVITATNGEKTKDSALTKVTISDGSSIGLGSSGISGSSGSSRGSSRTDISRNFASVPSSNANIYWGCLSKQSNPLTLKQATELFNTSLQTMLKNTTTLVLRAYNKTSVDISVLNSLKSMADKNGVCVIIYFDYVINRSVVSRIQVNPETATRSINLCLLARKHNLPKTNYLIKTYGDNVLRLEFAQKTNFGVNTPVTIKLPQNYKGDGIDFYQLNPATGKYTKISPVYSIDSKRYLTFNIGTTENIYICGN